MRELNQRLRTLGFAADDSDYFGRSTHAAVGEFQKRQSLEVDGVVGSKTWKALGGPPMGWHELANMRGYTVAAIALSEVNRQVREVGGDNRGPDVQRYQDATNYHERGGPKTGWAWCAAFVTWCYEQAGLVLRDSGGFSYVPWLKKWGKKAGHWRPRVPGYIPPAGAVVIYTFSHTGIVVQGQRGLDITAEGNTSRNGGSQRNGNGVYKKRRSHRIIDGYIVIPEILWTGQSPGMCPTVDEALKHVPNQFTEPVCES